MNISRKTQNVLLLVCIPIVVSIGFLAVAGNGTAAFSAMLLVPNGCLACVLWVIYRACRTGVIRSKGGRTIERASELKIYRIELGMAIFAALILLAIALSVDWLLLSAIFMN